MTDHIPDGRELLARLLPFVRAGNTAKGESSFYFEAGALDEITRSAALPKQAENPSREGELIDGGVRYRALDDAAASPAEPSDPCPYCHQEMAGADDCPKCHMGSPGRPTRKRAPPPPDAVRSALAMRLRASADHDGPQELKMVMRRIASELDRSTPADGVTGTALAYECKRAAENLSPSGEYWVSKLLLRAASALSPSDAVAAEPVAWQMWDGNAWFECSEPDKNTQTHRTVRPLYAVPPVRDREALAQYLCRLVGNFRTGDACGPDCKMCIDGSGDGYWLREADRVAILSLPSAPVSDAPDRISFPRWWIIQLRDNLMKATLPRGPLGDWAFLFREQLNDALNKPAPAPVSGRDAVIELVRAATRMRDMLTADGDPPSIFIPADIVDAGDGDAFTQAFDELATAIRSLGTTS